MSSANHTTGVDAQDLRTAILIPCLNEAQCIGDVVRDFRMHCPQAEVFVYDNASTDNTAEVARAAGATIGYESRPGKGHVMRTMFREIEADLYVMVDGDGTYPADRVQDLIDLVAGGDVDMAMGARLHQSSGTGFTLPKLLGNRLFRMAVNSVFFIDITDLLTGYRAMNRRVVKTIPFLSQGFEIETELTVKCLVRGYRLREVPIDLVSRPDGSDSKIRIVQDGLLIMRTIFSLLRDYRPLTAFGSIGMLLVLAGFIPGAVVINEFLQTNQILHMPSAVLAVGLVLSGMFVGFMGIVMHSVNRHFQEVDFQIRNLTEYQLHAAPPKGMAGTRHLMQPRSKLPTGTQPTVREASAPVEQHEEEYTP